MYWLASKWETGFGSLESKEFIETKGGLIIDVTVEAVLYL